MAAVLEEQSPGDLEPIHKAGAANADIKAGKPLRQTQHMLHYTAVGWGGKPGAYSGHNTGRKLAGVNAGALQGLRGSRGSQGGTVFFPGAEPPLPNAGAADNPLVAGVYLTAHVFVGDNVLRQGAARGDNP